MSRLAIFASAFSRLHADLVIVRLKRAGIATASISLLHPVSCRPNSAQCWLGGSTKLRLSSGEKVASSGFLRPLLQNPAATGTLATLDGKLAQLGLAHDQRVTLEGTLLENRVVVAIDVADKSELPTVFQVLQRAGAENVFTAKIAPFETLHEMRMSRPARAALPVAA